MKTRSRILVQLLSYEACECELMEVLGMSQSRIAHHLIVLRDAGFLLNERCGRWKFYRTDQGRTGGINL